LSKVLTQVQFSSLIKGSIIWTISSKTIFIIMARRNHKEPIITTEKDDYLNKPLEPRQIRFNPGLKRRLTGPRTEISVIKPSPPPLENKSKI
jgi:hypothetical protein